MFILLWIIIFFAVLVVLLFNRASFIVTTLAYGVLLLLLTFLTHTSHAWLITFWSIYLIVAVVFNVSFVRRSLITKKLFAIYKKLMPKMSATEAEALLAGNVGWEANLFKGDFNWQSLHNIPAPALTAEERAFLDGPVEELCGMINDWDITHQYVNLPPEVWSFLRSQGFWGLIIPKKYGGKEFSALAHSVVITKIASMSLSAATVVSVPNSLGPAELLLKYGTEAQREYYLPRLAKGEDIPCFALTSPVAGSDAASIVDHGIVCKKQIDGQEVLGIVLNWSKRYITLGPVATIIGLAFKLYDPEHLLGEQDYIGITCALVHRDTPGITIGHRHYPLNAAFPNGPNQGKDVFIKIDDIIGGAAMAGKGWRMLMECLAAGRGISLPSMASGGTLIQSLATSAYARIRRQFNLPIIKFGGVAEAFTDLIAKTYQMEAVRLFSVNALDHEQHSAVASAICKNHCTQLGRVVVNHVMDIHGGKAICLGPRNYVARFYEATPICITVEGANILTRSMIIFGQGAIRCHPYVLKEMHAAANDNVKQGLRDFDEALFAHVGLLLSNITRGALLGVSFAKWVRAPQGSLHHEYQQLEYLSAVFATTADVCMLALGAKLKFAEKLSARLGDLFSYLYMAAAILKCYRDEGEHPEHLCLIQWLMQNLFYEFQQTFFALTANLPQRGLGWWLRWKMFPYGKHYKLPTDKLGALVVQAFMQDESLQSQFKRYVYTAATDNNVIGRMLGDLPNILRADLIEKTFTKALHQGEIQGYDLDAQLHSAVQNKVLTEAQAQQLREARRLAMQYIEVDDFTPEEIGTTNDIGS